jgi:hypothetical protein
MKKFLGKVIMKKVILPERYFAKGLEKQGKDDKGKELPPKPRKLHPVLGRGPAIEQQAF